MNKNDFEQFSAIWISAWELTGKAPTEGAVRLAYESLKNCALQDIQKMISQHILDPDGGIYPVRPSDIIRHLGGGKADRAARAFRVAMMVARHIGSYESVVFDDPLIAWTIDEMGGWRTFCETPLGENNEKLHFVEMSFCKRYQAYLISPPKAGGSPPCVGIIEHTNILNGYPESIHERIAIGDRLLECH